MKELELSRKLATLDTKLQLEQPFETLKVGEPDKNRLRELLTRQAAVAAALEHAL